MRFWTRLKQRAARRRALGRRRGRGSVVLGMLMTTVVFAVGAAPAQAHRAYSVYTAQDHVYSLYSSHCGNGITWVCVNRRLVLRATPVGDHSWEVYYSWQEATFGNNRWCDVDVRDDTHVGWVVQVYQGESCHG